eukprot:evm.model.scf_2338.1 EVM.evm.TU.scf_2338.1   scf_2338:14628-17498(+)
MALVISVRCQCSFGRIVAQARAALLPTFICVPAAAVFPNRDGDKLAAPMWTRETAVDNGSDNGRGAAGDNGPNGGRTVGNPCPDSGWAHARLRWLERAPMDTELPTVGMLPARPSYWRLGTGSRHRDWQGGTLMAYHAAMGCQCTPARRLSASPSAEGAERRGGLTKGPPMGGGGRRGAEGEQHSDGGWARFRRGTGEVGGWVDHRREPKWMHRGRVANRGKTGPVRRKNQEQSVCAGDAIREDASGAGHDKGAEGADVDDLLEFAETGALGKVHKAPVSESNPFTLPQSRPSLATFHTNCPETLKKVDVHFAEWFIGFTEVQDAFVVEKDGSKAKFCLYHPDIMMFYKIRQNLHFGKVDKVVGMYYVDTVKGLLWLAGLFNGNLFLEESRESFRKWIDAIHQMHEGKEGDESNTPISVESGCCWRPQLNNAWLMGFVDANLGMFGGRIVEVPDYPFFNVELKFWLITKERGLAEHLKRMFRGGDIEGDIGGHYKWTVRDNKQHAKIARYCKMFKPKTQKQINVLRYNRLFNYPIMKVKTNKAWEKIRRLVDSLNQFEKKRAVATVFHPYHGHFKETVDKQIEVARSGGHTSQVNAEMQKIRKEDEKEIGWELLTPAPTPKRQF